MPNNPNISASVEIEEFEETEDFSKDDFAFVIGPDGDLKTFNGRSSGRSKTNTFIIRN